MKVVGFITEYNPFHFGHKHHLETSKDVSGADYSIAVMSGSFVQRGEPSFVDKWTKTKMAIDNGVDLVIELPFIFAIQSAELFAYGGIGLLNSLNIVDYIVFGSELDNIDYLNEIAKVLAEEPHYYKQTLKKYLNMGYSFSVSRSCALEEYLDKASDKYRYPVNIKNVLKMSNNILAIEYLKALILLNSSIKPIAIKRVGSHYSEENLNNELSSATSIRKTILEGNIAQIKSYVPKNTFCHLKNYVDQYKRFNTLDNYNQILHYLLGINGKKSLIKIMDVEEGLENRILEKSIQYNDINTMIQSIVTKRYPRTRIQRILVHLMANLTQTTFHELSPYYPSYLRVLGANEKGLYLLSKIKGKSSIPIITKFADYSKLKNPRLDKMICFDKKSTDLFFIGLNLDEPFMNMDYYTSPYIKNK